jgi:hypothetical protein
VSAPGLFVLSQEETKYRDITSSQWILMRTPWQNLSRFSCFDAVMYFHSPNIQQMSLQTQSDGALT